jgi:hypothetical protein
VGSPHAHGISDERSNPHAHHDTPDHDHRRTITYSHHYADAFAYEHASAYEHSSAYLHGSPLADHDH